MNPTKHWWYYAWWSLVAVFIAACILASAQVADATPDPEGDGHKVGICHRTASDSNPYVYIEVDEASLSPGHLDNADPGHKPTYWKSDGTFRGVAHVAGDPKDDYLAPGGAGDCEDFEQSPSPTPSPSPSPPVDCKSCPDDEGWTSSWTPSPPDDVQADIGESPRDTLAQTGADVSWPAFLGLSALTLGLSGLYVARKRFQ